MQHALVSVRYVGAALIALLMRVRVKLRARNVRVIHEAAISATRLSALYIVEAVRVSYICTSNNKIYYFHKAQHSHCKCSVNF